MTYRDHRGLPMTAGLTQSIEAYEQALTQLHGYYGDPLAVIDAALDQDPELLAGLALRAGMLTIGTERRALPELRATLDRAKALIQKGLGSERERAHFAAARSWLDGDFTGAVEGYNRIALAHPRDALALQISHVLNFCFGRGAWLRDHIAAALPQYASDEPTRSYLLGMFAFGLEECGEYARAEQAGRSALERNPRDPWAVHAVAHCFEMQGRIADGIQWMQSRVTDWAPDNALAVHNFWHLALYYLDLGDRKRVLELYDEHIRKTPSEVNLDLVDASSMLWRLELSGFELEGRWQELASVFARIEEDDFYSFNDLHATMAYAGARRADDVARVLAGLERTARGSSSNAILAREIGLPACRAVAAFAEGDYARATDLLFGVRPLAHRFGGSHAQRDVLDFTLVEAALRGGQMALARSLIEARIAQKPESPAAFRSLARVFATTAPELAPRVQADAARFAAGHRKRLTEGSRRSAA